MRRDKTQEKSIGSVMRCCSIVEAEVMNKNKLQNLPFLVDIQATVTEKNHNAKKKKITNKEKCRPCKVWNSWAQIKYWLSVVRESLKQNKK